MLESLFSKEPAAPVDLTPFASAMPAIVREELEQPGGACELWRSGSRVDRIVECFTLANRSSVNHAVFGWMVGITAFEDERQQVTSVLLQRSFRDGAIGSALAAMATGIAAGKTAPPKLWSTFEALAVRLESVPPSLAPALPVGVVSRFATVRGVALRLAQKLGTIGRAAIEAARPHAVGAERALIDDALAALAGGTVAAAPAADDVALLGKLLDAWRATRDAELERAIARVGAALSRTRGAIEAKSKSELEAVWLALAAHCDAGDVARLFDAPWPRLVRPTVARVRALAAFAPDPRIAVGVVAIARRFHDVGLCRDALAIAERAATRALLPELDALRAVVQHDDHHTWWRRDDEIASLVRAIEAMQPVAADPELLAETARFEDRAEIDALFAEVWANPGDIGARAVLADALQLAGDPRGDFIALQLADSTDPQIARKAEALLVHHGDAWAGPLPGVDARSRRFERGFLVAARTAATEALLHRSLARPEWRTVEELSLVGEAIAIEPLLRRVPLLRRLAARDASLRRLGGSYPGIRTVFSDGTYVPPRSQFPDLEVLGIGDGANLVDAMRVATALGVRALVVVAGAPGCQQLLRLRGDGPRELRLVVGAWRGFELDSACVVRLFRDTPALADVAHHGATLEPAHRSVLETLRSVGVQRIATYQTSPRLLFVESWLGVEIVGGAAIAIAD